MRSIKNLLVAIDESEDARYVLEKAQILAVSSNANVHVVRVIYEGIAELNISDIENSVQLKSFMLESAETFLEDLCEGYRTKIKSMETVTVWNPKAWEGVLHAAETVDADLIVKAVSVHERFGDVIRTPDDWNLLRHSEVPVMLVKEQAWVPKPVILAALDIFDDSHAALNLEVLRDSATLASILDAELHVVCAYPIFEPWAGELGALKSYEDLKLSIETDISERVEALRVRAEVSVDMVHMEEGHATHAIGQIAETTDAEVLFIGTHAREGIKGILLGNTSEKILHAVSMDVVTVHSP